MHQKFKLTALLIIIFICIAGFGIEKYFQRTIVYECTNIVTKMPVFIKITTTGAIDLLTKGTSYIDVDLHDTDGEIYPYFGLDDDYFDDDVFIERESPILDKAKLKQLNAYYTISFDLLTSGYQVHHQVDGESLIMASGFCKIQ